MNHPLRASGPRSRPSSSQQSEADLDSSMDELMRRSQKEMASYGNDKFDSFYSAFSGAAILETAVKEDTVPFYTKKSLNTYFKRVYGKRPASPEPPRHLPHPYNHLVRLQNKDGRWTDVEKILTLLDLPRSVLLEGLEAWENATVFALAAIRQRPDLAQDLMDAHDRAFQWMESRGLVYRALERIYTAEGKDEATTACSTHDIESIAYDHTRNGARSASMAASMEGGGSILLPPAPLSPLAAGGPAVSSSYSSLSGEHPRSNESPHDKQEAGHELETLKSSSFSSSSPPMAPTTGPPKSQQILVPGDPTAQADYERIARDLKELEEKIVGLAAEFEAVSFRLERVCEQAVKTYITASTHADRNVAFYQLTCILGEGLRPISGVTDWRAAGAPSFRQVCVDILSSLQRVAELRLDLEEARLRWRGYPMRLPQPSAEMIDARWTFTWGGKDLALTVLSSLDWLQAVPTVTEWYGRPFSLVANPLSLPINLVDLYNRLGMEAKVEEQMCMRPFAKVLCGAQGTEAQHKQRIFLNRWGLGFEAEVSKARISKLWPENPDVSNFTNCDKMYAALLVLYAKGRRGIMRAIRSENEVHCNIALAQSREHFVRETVRQLGLGRSGKPGSGWRGSVELSNTAQSKGKDAAADSARMSTAVGNNWKPLPKLSSRPTSRKKSSIERDSDEITAVALEEAPEDKPAANIEFTSVISISTEVKFKENSASDLAPGAQSRKPYGDGGTASTRTGRAKSSDVLPPVKTPKTKRSSRMKSAKVSRAVFPEDMKLTRKARNNVES